MAALASTAVVRNDYWYTGSFVGAKRKVVDVTLTLTGQGSVANSIPAALFGMTKITGLKAATGSDNKTYVGGPSYDGTQLTLGAGVPADVTGTLRCIIEGKD